MAANNSAQSLSELARTRLEDLAVRALLQAGEPLRSSGLAEIAFPGTRLSGDLWRHELEQSERIYLTEDRRWNLTACRPATGRTVEGTIEALLKAADVPIHKEQIAKAVLVVRGAAGAARITPTVFTLLETRDKYIEVGDGEYGLAEWLIDTSGGEEELVIMENFLDQEPDFASTQETFAAAGLAPGTPPLQVCQRLLADAGKPVSFRVLSFFCWKVNPNKFAGVELLRDLWASDTVAPLFPGRWCSAELMQKLHAEILQVSRDVARTSRPALGTVADLDSLLAAKIPESAVVTLSEEDIAPVLQLAHDTQTPIDLVHTLAESFETYPADDSFVPMAQALAARLNRDSRLQLVGPGLWVFQEQIPAEATRVPDGIEPVMVEARTIDGEMIDALLEDAAFDSTLTKVVRDPYWEDFGEEDEIIRVPQNKQSREELVYTVLYHHYQTGTCKLRKMDETFFPDSPALLRIVIADDGSGDHEAWVNRETGLITGLKNLYDARLQPSGSTFRLTKTPDAGVYQFALDPELHPQAGIGPARLDELQQLAAEERSQTVMRTMLDIMKDLFILTPKGFEFVTLWAELNVIRRTSKRLVASTLASYPCFYERKGKAHLWSYDDRKSDQGRLRVVKKHMRK